jgi:iron complex outermembrane receptor protein
MKTRIISFNKLRYVICLVPIALLQTITFAQNATTPSDNIVKLDAYNVTTTLDHYTDVTAASAMKMPVAQLDLPFSVQGLNSAFLNDIRTSRLEDAFGYITGLNKQGDAANQFTLRGFTAAGSNLQSLQIDGLPGPTSRFASPPSINVERLEVIKGPTSVLYGQANPGGLLNVITKSPKLNKGTVLSTSISTYDGQTSSFGNATSYTTSFDTTGPIDIEKHWLYRLVVSYEDQKSYRDYYFQKNKYIYPSLTYRWNANTSLTIKGDYTREDRQANDGLAVPFLNAALLPAINVSYTAPDARDTDYGESLTALFNSRLSDNLSISAMYRSTYHTDTRNAEEVAQQTITSNASNYLLSSIARRLRLQSNVKRYNFLDANTTYNFSTNYFKNTAMIGVNGGKEWWDFTTIAQGGTTPALTAINLYNSVPNINLIPTYPTIYTAAGLAAQRRRQTPFWNYGMYASDQIKIGDKFDLSLGIRHDKQDAYQKTTVITGSITGIKQTVAATVPSTGIVYHFNQDVSTYISYCEGFKPQAPGNVDVTDSPNLPAETSTQTEVGLKADAFNHAVSGTVSVYDIKKKNVLTATGQTSYSGNPIANLSGLQESKGVEFTLAFQPKPYWQIETGYTYIDARVKASLTSTIIGAILDNTPHNSANVWTRYNIPDGTFKGLGFGLGYVYAGTRQAIITNIPTTITINPTTSAVTSTGRLLLPSYSKLDFGIYYKYKRFDYAVNLSNILDRTFISGAIPGDATRLRPGDPRKVVFSLRYNL